MSSIDIASQTQFQFSLNNILYYTDFSVAGHFDPNIHYYVKSLEIIKSYFIGNGLTKLSEFINKTKREDPVSSIFPLNSTLVINFISVPSSPESEILAGYPPADRSISR